MDGIPRRQFDFIAARQRIMLLTMMYRQAKHSDDDMARWAIAAQIEEIEREIAEAHRAEKTKMTAVASGHPVLHIGNIVSPIVPQWQSSGKGVET